MFNPILRGWVQYYGQYYKSALYPTFQVLDRILVKWAMRQYKKLKGHQRRATHWLGRIARRQPRLFVHWQMGVRPAAGREEPDEPRGSRPDLRGRGGAIPPRYSTCATTARRSVDEVSTLKQPCCTQDEGWPLAAVLQEEAAHHLTRRWLRVRVVSGEETARHDRVRYGSRRRAQANH